MRSPSVLAVVAHPDDESFGLGALLSEAASAGSRVGVLCMTHGEASSLHGVEGDLRSIRESELQTAAKDLGACWVRLLDHPDGGLQTSEAILANDVAQAVRTFSPDLLLTFDTTGITGHPDHIAVTRATVHAGRMADLPVLGWTLPERVAAALADEGVAGFVGRSDSAIALVVEVDRTIQLRAVQDHPSQAVPGSPLWRRLELLGDREHLRQLHSTGNGSVPFRLVQTTPASPVDEACP
jgi:LmbE family N-acetylglucosaminyl deacetylase